MANARQTRLERIASDFHSREWHLLHVLSPERHVEKAEVEFEMQPNAVTKARIQCAMGKWAIIFGRPWRESSRSDKVTNRELEAIVAFTPGQVDAMSDHEILRGAIGVIASLELHEVLEWSQFKSVPYKPIVDPHTATDDVLAIVKKVTESMVNTSTIN